MWSSGEDIASVNGRSTWQVYVKAKDGDIVISSLILYKYVDATNYSESSLDTGLSNGLLSAGKLWIGNIQFTTFSFVGAVVKISGKTASGKDVQAGTGVNLLK